MRKVTRLFPSQTGLLAVVASAAALLATGCGFGTAATSGTTLPAMAGVVHGGQSGIQNAKVTLYVTSAVATTYGAAATVISTTTSDQFGSFTIPLSATAANCPAGQQAYLTAAGGYQSMQPTLANTSMLMIAALGDCKNISATTSVDIDELTTVAAAYALSGFTTTSLVGGLYQANISAPVANNSPAASPTANAPAGLAHAFLNATSLVNFSTGAANTTTTASSGGTTVTGTIPAVELNTLGDILQSCINGATGNTNCTALFGFTPSIAGVAPANTLQAFVNLARNPYPSAAAMNTSTGLLSLVPASGAAFAPTLTAAPNDWALAIAYNAYTGNPNPPSLTVLAKPYWLALDANDTVYVGLSTTSTTLPALYGVSVYGNTVPLFGSPTAGTATRGIAVDMQNNIWVDTNGTTLYHFASTGGAPLLTYTTLGSSIGVTIDKANNVWVGHAIAAGINVDEFAYNATAATWTSNYTAQAPGGVYGITVDPNQNIWLAPYYSSGTSGVSTDIAVLANTGTTALPAYVATGTTITPIVTALNGSATHPYGSSIDASGNAWYGIYGTPPSAALAGVDEIVPNSTSALTSITAQTFLPGTTAGSGTTSGNTIGVQVSNLTGIDGAGTLFLSDNNGTYTMHMYNTVSGQVLSPTNGIIGCALPTTAPTVCGNDTATGAIYNPRDPVVDSTGSVWLGWTNGGITQLIGLGAPSYPVLAASKPGLSPGLTAVNPLP